ncbi:hypothetical protein EDC01DRAFT_731097 [Geopyxis carbonaria]|nr:hypothetical protein EDC01DRAFT_731097 [Geopyxis carbonaria]
MADNQMTLISYQRVWDRVMAKKIDNLTSTSLEDKVKSVWLPVLYTTFTTAHGFTVEAIRDINPQNEADFLVVKHYQGDVEHPLIVVDCKRSEFENRDAEWEKAKDRLSDYITAMEKQTCICGAQGCTSHVRGLICIGKKVGFYSWIPTAQTDGNLEPEYKRHFHIVQDQMKIQLILDNYRSQAVGTSEMYTSLLSAP